MHKLGVIVPFRNRDAQLRRFLREVPKYLKSKDLDHEIIVVEQMDEEDFNRGALLNVGVLEAEKRGCDYVVFHDVDLIPKYVDYSYSDVPLELVNVILDDSYEDAFEVKLENLTDDYFGGVTLFPIETFKKINGYSNKYVGWGFEDNDLLKRCQECLVPLGTKSYRQLYAFESSLYFNGVDSFVQYPLGKINLKRPTSFLVNFRVEDLKFDRTKIGDEACIFSIPGLDLNLAYTNYGTYKFEVFDNYEDVYSIHTTKMPVGIACQAIITIDPRVGKIVFYLNGSKVGETFWPSESRNLTVLSENLFLGAGNPNREGSEKWFTGQISEFAIFNKVFSSIEVTKIFSNSLRGLGPLYPEVWLNARVFRDDLFLPDLSGNSNKDGIVQCCTVEPMISLFETYQIVVPWKRDGKFKCLPHETNGSVWGYWKNWATRLNQERYKVVEALGTNRAIDGLSTVSQICKTIVYDLKAYQKVQVFFNEKDEE